LTQLHLVELDTVQQETISETCHRTWHTQSITD